MKSLHAKQTNKQKKTKLEKASTLSIKNQKIKQTVSKTKCGFLKYRFKTKRLMFYRDQKQKHVEDEEGRKGAEANQKP